MHIGESHAVMITFSARTNSENAQSSVLSKLQSGRQGTFFSAGDKNVIVMIDDVNMPEVDSSGT